MTTSQGRLFPAKPRRRGRNRRNVDATVTAMRRAGLLEPIDAALVTLARESADQLDDAAADPDESRFTRATLIGRHLAVLRELAALRSFGPDDDAHDNLADLLASVGDAPS